MVFGLGWGGLVGSGSRLVWVSVGLGFFLGGRDFHLVLSLSPKGADGLAGPPSGTGHRPERVCVRVGSNGWNRFV